MNCYDREDLKVGDKIAVFKYRKGRFSWTLETATYGTVTHKTSRQIKTSTGHSFRVNDGCEWGVEKYSYRDNLVLHYEEEAFDIEKQEEDKASRAKYSAAKKAILENMVKHVDNDSGLLELMAELKVLLGAEK